MTMMKTTLQEILARYQADAAGLDRNDEHFTYTIFGFEGDPYITRTLFPRAGGVRVILHKIHREDRDRHMHNHPWARATFTILSGGYVEERLVDPVEGFGEHLGVAPKATRVLGPGDVNQLDASTFHRIVSVEPDTWTIGVVGERVQEWGFLVDGFLVEWKEYFRRNGHAVEVSSLS